VQERYIAALIPTLFIWFGHGVIESGDWLVGTGKQLLPEKHAQRSRLRNRQQIAFNEGGGSPKAMAVFTDENTKIENGHCLRHLIWLPLLMLALFMLFYTPRQVATATNPGSTREVHDLAAASLAPQIQPDDIVMTRYVSIAFHAGADWVPTPAADVAAVLAYAQRKGADYWAIDEFEAETLRPQFAPLIENPDNPPPGLEFVTQVENETGSVFIFRITP